MKDIDAFGSSTPIGEGWCVHLQRVSSCHTAQYRLVGRHGRGKTLQPIAIARQCRSLGCPGRYFNAPSIW
ncbi:hypothetical protein OVY29_11065 [Sphingopyxis sp. SE2]|uniref:hypothetical protein n=1 Tax=Sphingopyxis sp. SE2 TaxID=1586240 RepID=UPI0028C31607|nr:hypothetical protein [Sphingopyxis sp. SE2]MDT7529205.1 hypothetical protein [Sphingopyxis sp. SE2]